MTQRTRAITDDIGFQGAVFARVALPEVESGERGSCHDAPRVLSVTYSARVSVVRYSAFATRTFHLAGRGG